MDVNHDPDSCPKKKSAIRLLEATEEASVDLQDDEDFDEDDYEDPGQGMSINVVTHDPNDTVQISDSGGEDFPEDPHSGPSHTYRKFLSKFKLSTFLYREKNKF